MGESKEEVGKTFLDSTGLLVCMGGVAGAIGAIYLRDKAQKELTQDQQSYPHLVRRTWDRDDSFPYEACAFVAVFIALYGLGLLFIEASRKK